jgi:drug/metabolite transporter (DMT)-like permease
MIPATNIPTALGSRMRRKSVPPISAAMSTTPKSRRSWAVAIGAGESTRARTKPTRIRHAEIHMSTGFLAPTMASRQREYALILLASVLWGTSFPGSKLTVGTVDPLFLTFARMALGAGFGLAVLAALHRLDLRVFREPMVWAVGAINAAGFELQNEGIVLTTASKTALLVNVNVVFVAVLMVLFFRESVTKSKVAGILIGVFGVVVLATKFDTSSLAGGQFTGDVLVFLAGLVWAFYVIGAKKMVDRGGDYIGLASGILATTAIVAAIPLFFVGWPLPASSTGWFGILYLGLVPTFPPLMLYVSTMRTISPTISSLLILLEVVVASILAFVMFRDPLDAYTLAGGALILLGAFVATRGEQRTVRGGSGLAAPPDPGSQGPDK